MLDGVRNSAQRGAGLTKQLLAFARAQPLQIKQVDLKSFFADVSTLIRPSLRSNIEVVTELSDQLWPVDADAGALELAILNLAFNARDAMKDGGSLKISAHNAVLDGEPDGLKGEHVALTVADTGTGMSTDVMERIFEPFFTTKSFGEGTGLGLSQVFGFAKQIGGALTVELKPDRARPSPSICRRAAVRPRTGVARTAAMHSAVCSSSRTTRWSPSWPPECSANSASNAPSPTAPRKHWSG